MARRKVKTAVASFHTTTDALAFKQAAVGEGLRGVRHGVARARGCGGAAGFAGAAQRHRARAGCRARAVSLTCLYNASKGRAFAYAGYALLRSPFSHRALFFYPSSLRWTSGFPTRKRSARGAFSLRRLRPAVELALPGPRLPWHTCCRWRTIARSGGKPCSLP